jgi:hypothetical protein
MWCANRRGGEGKADGRALLQQNKTAESRAFLR